MSMKCQMRFFAKAQGYTYTLAPSFTHPPSINPNKVLGLMYEVSANKVLVATKQGKHPRVFLLFPRATGGVLCSFLVYPCQPTCASQHVPQWRNDGGWKHGQWLAE